MQKRYELAPGVVPSELYQLSDTERARREIPVRTYPSGATRTVFFEGGVYVITWDYTDDKYLLQAAA